MGFWNFTHNSLGLHFWIFFAIVFLVVMLVVALVHHKKQEKREEEYEEELNKLSSPSQAGNKDANLPQQNKGAEL